MKIAQADRTILETSGLFDADWYRRQYPDVDMLGMDPLEHFLWLGGRLLRNPGPRFNAEQYLQAHDDLTRESCNPVLHYLQVGKAEGRQIVPCTPPPTPPAVLHPPAPAPARTTPARPATARTQKAPPQTAKVLPPTQTFPPGMTRVAGGMAHRPGRPTIMLCAHVAGNALFGGERSFIDMLDGLVALDYNVVVTTPSRGNAAYFETMRSKTTATYVFRYGWWRKTEPVKDQTVTDFAQVIQNEAVDVVHTNTIVLRDPLLAARRMGVRSIIHVRELIRHDDALLNMIGESADYIVDWMWSHCDHLIANSQATLEGFAHNGRTPSLVYNTADFAELAQLPAPAATGPLRVGLISSNIPKKGVEDFAQIALEVSKTHPDMQFCLIGPPTPATEDLMVRVQAGRLPASLQMLGYRDSPAQAVAEVDIVLNLSHFQESFGRTVLEGMVAGRPTIVYRYGAPPEFVTDGQTGFIVPLGDTAGVAAHLRALADNRARLTQIGEAAKVDMLERFGPKTYARQMGAAYEALMARDSTPAQMTLRARADMAPVARETQKIAYFSWHFPVPSETFVLNELRLLKEQGFDVQVFCKQSPFPDFKPDFDIQWERVNDADHLAQRLRETGRTMVHSHFVYPTVTDMVWPACEAAGVPFTFIAHAQDIFRYANDAKNRIDEVSQSPLCAKVFVPSRFHHAYLAERGVPEAKMMINANGCDVRLYEDGWSDARETRPFRRVVAIHRFTEKKGLIHLIRAGKFLEDQNIRIELYGYGDLEEEYRAAIAADGITNVHLCGPVKGREAMLKLYRESDLFACPSVRAADGDMDGIPTVLMEAMAAGLPVLTTDLSGIPDLVEDNVTGYISDANPQAIAARIRAFYKLPDVAVKAVIENAYARIAQDYNTEHLVDNLLRVWCAERIDLLIVSWNNLAEITEVTRRLYKYTTLPFHLVICDNGSGPEALAFLLRLQAENDNVTLVLNRENAMVGPGTNICLENGSARYAIYVCGKEGMTLRHGWEKPIVTYMNTHPKIGLAGTLCYSPSYLYGRDYPTGQVLFDKFRNPQFAHENPDRLFAHVQGGFFAMRRSMIDTIGGFSDMVPHNSTDVEFSYYVESEGWELGQLPGLMALFNKTRPGLFHRVDETMGALHPPLLEDLDRFDAIAEGRVHHCNACGEACDRFEDLDGHATCPHCRATRRSRSLHRSLAESMLLFRRLPALGVNVPGPLEEFWKKQFQGRVCSKSQLLEDLHAKGRTDFADGRLMVAMLNDVLGKDPAHDALILKEAVRVLRSSGTLILAGGDAQATSLAALADLGMVHQSQKRYASKVSHYDWKDIHFLIKP